MRTAAPTELKSHAYPLLTAAISAAELSKWFPVPFHYVTDPRETAEPARMALLRLDSGEYFFLTFGELSNEMMVRIPTSVDAPAFLKSFFAEVPLPRNRILWRREDAASLTRYAS